MSLAESRRRIPPLAGPAAVDMSGIVAWASPRPHRGKSGAACSSSRDDVDTADERRSRIDPGTRLDDAANDTLAFAGIPPAFVPPYARRSRSDAEGGSRFFRSASACAMRAMTRARMAARRPQNPRHTRCNATAPCVRGRLACERGTELEDVRLPPPPRDRDAPGRDARCFLCLDVARGCPVARFFLDWDCLRAFGRELLRFGLPAPAFRARVLRDLASVGASPGRGASSTAKLGASPVPLPASTNEVVAHPSVSMADTLSPSRLAVVLSTATSHGMCVDCARKLDTIMAEHTACTHVVALRGKVERFNFAMLSDWVSHQLFD